MNTTTTAAHKIPANLANHPEGDSVRAWSVYCDYANVIRAYGPTKNVMEGLAADCDHLASMYNPDSVEPSNLGVGRTAHALAQALEDLAPIRRQWADRMISNLPRLT